MLVSAPDVSFRDEVAAKPWIMVCEWPAEESHSLPTRLLRARVRPIAGRIDVYWR